MIKHRFDITTIIMFNILIIVMILTTTTTCKNSKKENLATEVDISKIIGKIHREGDGQCPNHDEAIVVATFTIGERVIRIRNSPSLKPGRFNIKSWLCPYCADKAGESL